MSEQHRHECECREWLKRYRERVSEVGVVQARKWLHETIRDIEKIRGKDAANRLKEGIKALSRVPKERSNT